MGTEADGHGDPGVLLVHLLGGCVDLVSQPVPGRDAVALRGSRLRCRSTRRACSVVVDEDLVGEDRPAFEVLDLGLGVAQRFHEHLVGEIAHALGDAEHAGLDVVDVEASVALLGGAADDVVAEREDVLTPASAMGPSVTPVAMLVFPHMLGKAAPKWTRRPSVVDAEQGHVLDNLDADVLIGLGLLLGVLQRLDADEPQSEDLLGAQRVAAVVAVDGAAVEFGLGKWVIHRSSLLSVP